MDKNRRHFISLVGTALASATAGAQVAKITDGGYAPVKQKQRSERDTPLVPPGAKSLRAVDKHCTACQLCIANCPNEVLYPSDAIGSLMQVRMDYSQGWCRPECNVCSQLCPTGAIEPITPEEKSSTKIGTAVVDLSTCISAAYGQECGLCARSCPAGAISMLKVNPDNDNRTPVVNAEVCIGCGSCEYHCPVGRIGTNRNNTAAIHVEGVEVHREI